MLFRSPFQAINDHTDVGDRFRDLKTEAAAPRGGLPDRVHVQLQRGVISISHGAPALRVGRMIRCSTDNNGFLLRGSDESCFTADAACGSLVSNFRLTVTYEIPTNGRVARGRGG